MNNTNQRKIVADSIEERFAEVNGVRLRYLIGGKGSPVVLLHGYTQTSHMWLPIMPALAQRHTVIVPDLRGAGGSAKPESGYDKKNMAVDVHELPSSLGFDRVSIVGHDIGLMVAYAYAAQFPQGTERVVLMDAFLPGIGNWKNVWLMRDLWHFHFYGDVPLALVKGRERTYFEHFWNDFAANPKHSVPEADRRVYAKAYAQPGGMRAGFEYFKAFSRDASDFEQFSKTKLMMPVLVLTGEKASGQFLIEQARLVATDVKGVVIEGSGHWLMEEAPRQVIPELISFIDESHWGESNGLISNEGGGVIMNKIKQQKIVADSIIMKGRIATMDERRSFAQAVAIKDGRFIAVGSDQEIMPYKGEKTKVIDAGGRTVIPGLNDSHLHTIRGGLNYNMELRWDGVPSLADALRMLREQAKRTPPPQWVRVVGGWTEFQFKERRMPTLDEINEVAPETPVFVLHLYDRAFLNRAALRAVGYTKDTPDPPAGEIQRDGKGNPTGLIVAKPNAYILYATLAKGPKLSYEDQVNSSRQFMRELNRLGITSVIDAGGGFQNYPEDYAVINDLAKQGLITTRIAYNLFTQRPKQEFDDFSKWIRMVKPGQGDNFYRVNGAGEMLVFSAADFEDFLEPRPDLMPTLEAELKKVVRLLAENRWPFRLHATYDESITRFLNIFEEVNRDVPFKGMRWFFDHAETISQRNIERVQALGGGIAIQDRMAFQGEYFINRYGAKMAEQSPPITRMLKMGIPVGAGTDATRVASYNPWVSLYWLVSGKTVGGTLLYPQANRIDRMEALRLYTVGSAWFSNEEKVKGSIEEGKLADLVVLSDDYFSVAEEQIKGIESVLTIVEGKVVYGAGDFGKLAPPPLPVSPDWSPAKTYGGYYRSASLASNTSSYLHANKGHGHPFVVSASGELWRLGCDCFAF